MELLVATGASGAGTAEWLAAIRRFKMVVLAQPRNLETSSSAEGQERPTAEETQPAPPSTPDR